MADSTITLIIIGATCILYLTEKFSVAVTTVMGMLALIFTGINCISNCIFTYRIPSFPVHVQWFFGFHVGGSWSTNGN